MMESLTRLITAPLVYNPDQKDSDRDGIGDACDDDTTVHQSLFLYCLPEGRKVILVWYNRIRD